MLILTRIPSVHGAPGSSVTIDGHLTLTVEAVKPHGLVLRVRNRTGGQSRSMVPYGRSVRFPEKALEVFAFNKPSSPGTAKLGFEAPKHVSIRRDDAIKVRAAA